MIIMIYEPGEDSFLIGNFLKDLCKNKSVLDVGAGSGYLAEIAMKNGARKVDAIDINEESVDVCKKKGIHAWQSDLFSNVEDSYDLIVFNPPYLPKDLDEDEESALITTGGERGSEILERFFLDVRNYLNEKGKILIVISSLTGVDNLLFDGFDFKLLGKKKLFFETLKVYLLGS